MQKWKTPRKKTTKIKIPVTLLVVLVLVLGLFNGNYSSTESSKIGLSGYVSSHQVKSSNGTIEYKGVTYRVIEVDGGNLSGIREANVAVDVGFGDRIYWAFTNDHGQLVYVIADKIVLQDEDTESVNSKGRYYDDEAKVPGTERKDLDEGHVIADSLGGVANAYNITPQNSTLNRHGNQAYMEKVIRDAGGCDDFVATITYPDTTTQIPSKYKFEYLLNGTKIVDEFENRDPETIKQTDN